MEAVLARLCRRSEISLTQAVKLPYLVDVVAQHVLGREIVGATYEAWEHGVVAREAWRAIRHKPTLASLSVREHQWSETGLSVRAAGTIPEGVLTPEEQEIVDFIAEKYVSWTATALGALTKDMNPHIDKTEWGTNRKAATDEEAYFRMSDEWRETQRRLRCQDLDDKSKWGDEIGDPKEYLRRVLG